MNITVKLDSKSTDNAPNAIGTQKHINCARQLDWLFPTLSRDLSERLSVIKSRVKWEDNTRAVTDHVLKETGVNKLQ